MIKRIFKNSKTNNSNYNSKKHIFLKKFKQQQTQLIQINTYFYTYFLKISIKKKQTYIISINTYLYYRAGMANFT